MCLKMSSHTAGSPEGGEPLALGTSVSHLHLSNTALPAKLLPPTQIPRNYEDTWRSNTTLLHPLLHGHGTYWSEPVGAPVKILCPCHVGWEFTMSSPSKLGSPLSLSSSLSSTATSWLGGAKALICKPLLTFMRKSMILSTAFIDSSPSTCPLEGKEKLPSLADSTPCTEGPLCCPLKIQTPKWLGPCLKVITGRQMREETITR